ncbi:sigma-70 family RNA polymerase sigma factor [Lacunimicrobium album]
MWPQQDNTQELLAKVKAGEADAVNDLIERHRTPLRRLVHLRLDQALARRLDASDIVQDVMLEATGRLDDYLKDPRIPFHLWLRQLAQDHIIDMHRRHRLAQRRSVDREQSLQAPAGDKDSSKELASFLKDQELTPAAASIRKELETQFLEALDRLEEPDREILLMRHYEQLGNGEVATLLGVSPAAAGMRHLRALRRLREVLGGAEDSQQS